MMRSASRALFLPAMFMIGFILSGRGPSAPEFSRSSEPLIDIGVTAAKGKGTVLIAVNWGSGLAKRLNLTVQFALDGSNVTLATGGQVTESKTAQGWRSFVFDLDVADALIVR